MPDMHTNRLANEKSPYLLQHAHNPVDWYAWDEEAFEKARAEDKPIFLSIGYSTCHWCHVMERESFEDERIAALLNRDFVPIKVDREERPDVDRIYMTFVQATTGGGGWPMSVWLTPDLEPFFGGTYFPPENRWGQPGFASVLSQLASAWRSDRERVLDSARDIVEQLQKSVSIAPPRPGKPVLDPAILDSGFFGFRRTFDMRLGGFGGSTFGEHQHTHGLVHGNNEFLVDRQQARLVGLLGHAIAVLEHERVEIDRPVVRVGIVPKPTDFSRRLHR